MIDLPEETVVQKIVEQTDLSEEDVREKIKEKLTQLSGLISEDGAAHIVANDLNVQLYKTEGALKVSELSTNAKQASVAAKVLQKYEVREFNKNGREGRVANMMVGDESGRIKVVLWNDQVDLFEKLNEDDIIQVQNPYLKENNGRLEMHLNERSDVSVNPQGVAVSAPQSPQKEDRELKYLKDLEGGEENVEVLGTIVQVYEPRFFPVDPETNRRVSDEDAAAGKPHVMNYVTTCFLDDGTANVRTTFWKKQTQHLFGRSDEEILAWKDDSSKAQDAKHELLGEIIKVVGRVKKNEEFDRVEFTANLVIKDVNPEEELKKLKEGEESSGEQTKGDAPAGPSEQESSKEEAPEEERAAHEKEASAEEPAQTKDDQESSTSDEEREVKPEDVKFSDASAVDEKEKKKSDAPSFKEEVVSIDDLEDL